MNNKLPNPIKLLKSTNYNECKIGSDDSVCSNNTVINGMKKMANLDKESFSPKLSDEKAKEIILDKAKEVTNCNTESCVLASDELKQYVNKHDIEKSKENMLPPGPSDNIDEWLSNFNIDDVLTQIAEVSDHLYHMHYHMIDFMETNDTLSTIDFKKLHTQGYKTVGVVLNTDVSTGTGIHWFCLFINFSTHTIEYFNSSGEPPIGALLKWLIYKVKDLTHIFSTPWKYITASKIQHQLNDDDSNCGVYSVVYIWARAAKVPIAWFNNNRITKNEISNMRKHLFRTHK